MVWYDIHWWATHFFGNLRLGGQNGFTHRSITSAWEKLPTRHQTSGLSSRNLIVCSVSNSLTFPFALWLFLPGDDFWQCVYPLYCSVHRSLDKTIWIHYKSTDLHKNCARNSCHCLGRLSIDFWKSRWFHSFLHLTYNSTCQRGNCDQTYERRVSTVVQLQDVESELENTSNVQTGLISKTSS